MALDIDWVARLRTAPRPVCPSDEELHDFVRNPEAVEPAAFAHIIRGCASCRTKLQEIALHPSVEDLRRYVDTPDDLPEQVLLHCIDCPVCQTRAKELIDGS